MLENVQESGENRRHQKNMSGGLRISEPELPALVLLRRQKKRERWLTPMRNRSVCRRANETEEDKGKRNEIRRQKYAASNTERKQALCSQQHNE